MNRNHIQFVLLSLVFVLSGMAQAADFAGGTGEPNDPYLIATAEQLLEADFSEPGTHYRLCANIDLDRKTITPNYFRAHLDGAGFEIQNAVVSQGGSFFGSIEPEGTIANLTLADLDLGFARPTEVSGWLGGMASVNYGTITDCGVVGWVATYWATRVGGFVGRNEGSIANCYFDGWVNTYWENPDADGWEVSGYVGGLASHNFGSITNSFARSVVIGRERVGGLVGYNRGRSRIAMRWAWFSGTWDAAVWCPEMRALFIAAMRPVG